MSGLDLDADLALLIGLLGGLAFAALVAFFTWLANRSVLRTSRVLRIAEFRQNWIDSLREDLAEFQSYGVTPNFEPSRERRFYELGTRIELRLNPDDPLYPDLQNELYGFLWTSHADAKDKFANNPQFISLSQKLLKLEWDRLKRDVKSGNV